ncbi:Integrin beta-PS [Halotydeus destructor]|nr:Integrin beta-PS [Halotydeus destructor]
MDTSCHIMRLSLISLVILVGNSTTQEITCLSAQTCGECISLAGCSWCSDPSRDNFLPRCDFADLIVKNCPSEHNYNPANEVVTDVNNDTATENDGNILNIVPKKVALKLRPNTTSKIRLRIEQTSNYPVDLYYLMDLTHSMKDHKETLSVLAEELGIEMANITGNFRLGFGSFIDKVVMPFANMLPEKLINPCSDGAQCVPPYGFRNHLSLTDNLTLFVNEVRSASLSANLDNAEGGFDALMQVLMCVDEIGWKPQHRRIILFATDSIFHYAGDGKLGGIVKPNDGQCHLDKNGYYSETLKQDYPSLEQINRAITQQDVNIIFAVPEKLRPKSTRN